MSVTASDQLLWGRFRQATKARIGLGRTGNAMPSKALLDFQLSFARAKDAVHGVADFETLSDSLAPHGCVEVASQATTRAEYLRRPDLGRRLSADSLQLLEAQAGTDEPDLAFVVCDGLSAAAVMAQAVPVLHGCLSRLEGWAVPAIVLARHGRVALGDEVAHALRARMVVVLIGERPGLSSPDSLGLYLSWGAAPGMQDSQRNCISNVHGAGLSPDVAAQKAVWLIREATRLRLTGTGLKEDFPALAEARTTHREIG